MDSKGRRMLITLEGIDGSGKSTQLAILNEWLTQTFNDVIFTGYVDDEDIPQLIKGARIFAFPSLYEGFGIPVIEAMACGIPTIVSSNAALPEIVGDGAIVLKKNNSEEMMKSIMLLLENSEYYDEMSKKAVQRAKLFTWENTYKQLIEQINKI